MGQKLSSSREWKIQNLCILIPWISVSLIIEFLSMFSISLEIHAPFSKCIRFNYR